MTPTPQPPDGAPAVAVRRQVFIDLGLLTLAEAAPDRRQPGRRISAPGADEAVALIRESHDVVVIADAAPTDVPELAGLPSSVALPETFPHGSWYVTADTAWCEGDRPAGLRTILVGPRRPPARRPTVRCDHESRDLSTAMMEILVRESMA